jgi:hypothetical protein
MSATQGGETPTAGRKGMIELTMSGLADGIIIIGFTCGGPWGGRSWGHC